MAAEPITIYSEQSKAAAHAEIDRIYEDKPWMQIKINTDQSRTPLQNSSLHLYFKMVADALNNSGQERRLNTPIGQVEVPWTMASVKENLWRPIQIAITKKVSTKDPKRGEYAKIYDVLNRHLAESKGIHVPWPQKNHQQNTSGH